MIVGGEGDAERPGRPGPLRRLARRLLPAEDDAPLVAQAPAAGVVTIIRRFWPDLRPQRRWIWAGLGLAVLVPVVEAAEIWLFKLVVDEVLVPRDLGPLPWIAGAAVVLTLLLGVLRFADDYVAALVGGRFVLALRTRVFRHMARLSPSQLARRRVGDLVSRLSGDVAAIETLVLAGLVDAVVAVATITVFAGVMIALSWQLALVALVVAPMFVISARAFSRLIRAAARERRRRTGTMSAVAEEGLGGLALVQAYGHEEEAARRFAREGDGVLDAELAATRVRGVLGPVVDLLELAAGMAVVGLGTWLVADDRMSLGALLAFLAYLTQLLGPARDLGSLSNSVFAAAAGAERVIELLDEEPAVRERPGARWIGPARGALALESVTYTYPGAGRPAIRDVTLRLEPGDSVAVVGASGAGKSTLARLVARLEDPSGGRILVDGHDLRDLTLASVRGNVASLLQESVVMNTTVAANIRLGRPDAADEDVRRAAADADADVFVSALPEGYETVLGDRGATLSGGERRRVAIARALLHGGPVLVLDEPTTGLDESSQARLLPPLRRLMRGRTTLLITHDLRVAREADRIVVMADGRIVQQGRHDDLIAAGGAYAALVGAAGGAGLARAAR